jgi:RNA polymerase sigma-70 factor (ECF subfamily)
MGGPRWQGTDTRRGPLLDDQQAISAVLTGDVNAFAVLVERYQKPIYNLMYRMTGSQPDALDLAQETFIKAFEKLDRFQTGKNFFPWLYTIGINHARNFLRRTRLEPKPVNEDWEEDGPVTCPGEEEERLCLRLDQQRLQEALLQLPEDYREAIVLRYQEELSMEDIAASLKLSVSGAKMRVYRGLDKLRQMFVG